MRMLDAADNESLKEKIFSCAHAQLDHAENSANQGENARRALGRQITPGSTLDRHLQALASVANGGAEQLVEAENNEAGQNKNPQSSMPVDNLTDTRGNSLAYLPDDSENMSQYEEGGNPFFLN